MIVSSSKALLWQQPRVGGIMPNLRCCGPCSSCLARPFDPQLFV